MRIISNKYFHVQVGWISFLIYLSLVHRIISAANNDIALDCGSIANTKDMFERAWAADDNLNFMLLDPNNSSTMSQAIRSPKLDAVPDATARLSRSQFTYSFPVATGQKFIRLHFFPASYAGFSNTDAFFTVKAGRYTLLSNFSAALHAQDLKLDYFAREFCLNIEDEQTVLNITFIPSQGMPDVYAFINAIEIVSMPTDLYYTNVSGRGIHVISPGSLQSIENKFALALMYRINVGGSFISPKDDTANMFRSWESPDDEYLTVNKASVLPANLTTVLDFSQIPNYSAPARVYQTARSMGIVGATNVNYNLTWEFKVDPLFTYFIRLHFCEFQPPIQKIGDRTFQIFIDNQTAEEAADVIKWSGGNGFPIYNDYAIWIGKGSQKVPNLSIALHALSGQMSAYSDAILNGIEIFKLSNWEDDLSGPNPEMTIQSDAPAVSPKSSTKPKNKWTKVGAIIGGALSGFVILFALFLFIFRRSSKRKGKGAYWGPFSTPSSKSVKNEGSTLPSDLCRRFSLADIKEATNNFDSVFIVGVGGFGNVYKGHINDGAISVAIKRLNPGSEQGANEFKTEIEMLSQLRYLHLVSLIGYCYEDDEMILVYDYMAKGTLRDHLYKTSNPPLPWTRRLEICIGAAKALQYLHSGAKNIIIHRDVKTTNILLDEKWVAKVSDFGLSKIGPTCMSKQHISTVVKGSFGYLDPEYYRLQRLTVKSDVYSFGVVLFEVLSARPPVNKSSFNKPASLAEWARQCYRKGTLDDIVDPHLKGKIALDCLKSFFGLGISCLHDNGTDRPSMSDIVWRLEFALQLQETAILQGKQQAEMDIDMEMEKPLKGPSSVDDSGSELFRSSSGLVIGSRLNGMTFTSSSDDQSFLSNNSDQKLMSGAVFQES